MTRLAHCCSGGPCGEHRPQHRAQAQWMWVSWPLKARILCPSDAAPQVSIRSEQCRLSHSGQHKRGCLSTAQSAGREVGVLTNGRIPAFRSARMLHWCDPIFLSVEASHEARQLQLSCMTSSCMIDRRHKSSAACVRSRPVVPLCQIPEAAQPAKSAPSPKATRVAGGFTRQRRFDSEKITLDIP